MLGLYYLALLVPISFSAALHFDNKRETTLQRVLIDQQLADERGAHCLDGTPPGFFFQPAVDDANSKKWVLFMKGGEWCADEGKCAKRAESSMLGTTSMLGTSFKVESAPPFLNKKPWASYNRVLLWYCDGGLFGGDRDEPVNGIYYQGKRVLDLQLEVLKTEYGLSSADEVVLAGNSAGGLSVFLHADRIREHLPKKAKYKAVPISGYFVPKANDGLSEDLKSLYETHNLEAVTKYQCRKKLPKEEAWKCITGNYTYALSETPMFPIQSPLDGFALVYVRDFSRTTLKCMVKEFNPKLCNNSDLHSLNGLIAQGVKEFEDLDKFHRPGEGGFIMSCPGHMMFQMTGSDKVEIDGKSMDAAILDWWNAPRDEPAEWYLPCNLKSNPPHQCNPSCHAAPPAGAGL